MFTAALLFILLPFSILAQSPDTVENQVEAVDQLRQALVKSVSADPTINTFKQVCSPVGLNIKKIKKEKGIAIRQATHKPRNPNNLADKDEMWAIEVFKKRKDLKSLWITSGSRKHFFQPIWVKSACLACHGAKSARPQFVKTNYPKDIAFGFKKGDLRGVYHVVLGKDRAK